VINNPSVSGRIWSFLIGTSTMTITTRLQLINLLLTTLQHTGMKQEIL